MHTTTTPTPTPTTSYFVEVFLSWSSAKKYVHGWGRLVSFLILGSQRGKYCVVVASMVSDIIYSYH